MRQRGILKVGEANKILILSLLSAIGPADKINYNNIISHLNPTENNKLILQQSTNRKGIRLKIVQFTYNGAIAASTYSTKPFLGFCCFEIFQQNGGISFQQMKSLGSHYLNPLKWLRKSSVSSTSLSITDTPQNIVPLSTR